MVPGVPQGSILGRLIFNLYLNDIVNISHTATFDIFANYNSILFSGDKIDEHMYMQSQDGCVAQMV